MKLTLYWWTTITVMLAVLKLFNLIDISWWLVFCPLYIPILAFIILIIWFLIPILKVMNMFIKFLF